jgi:uroporphyrinogen-III synthase
MSARRLIGRTIAVTADRNWEEQADLLSDEGADVVHVPTMSSVRTGPDDALFAITERVVIEAPASLVAATSLGMRSWFTAAQSWGVMGQLGESLRRSELIVTPAAAIVLQQAGLSPDVVIDGDLAASLSREMLSSGLVAVERSQRDDASLAMTCRTLGATVVEVPVHRWILPPDIDAVASLVRRTVGGEIDAMTFTSAAAARNLALVADEVGLGDALRRAVAEGVVMAAVGPVCAQACRDVGLTNVAIPTRFRVRPLIEALATALARTPSGSR